jgi:hypothetical protein
LPNWGFHIPQIRPEIAKFELREKSHPQDSLTKAVSLDWEHLDPGFAVKVQVIYSGTDETEAKIDGYIVGPDSLLKDGSQSVIDRYLPFASEGSDEFIQLYSWHVCWHFWGIHHYIMV